MLTLMTYNVYLGADLTPLLMAQTEADFVSAVERVLAQLDANDFRVRAKLLAQEISAVQPDLIALQEVVTWNTSAFPSRLAKQDAKRDYLQLLLNALRSMGHEYWPVSLAYGPDIQGPASYPSLRFTNRNVILVRSNFCTGSNDIRLSTQGQFAVNVEVPSPILGPVSVTRAWASIDVVMRGTNFRLISVHLEDSHPLVRQAQAAELIRRLRIVNVPIVLVGDFNTISDPEQSTTYAALLDAGFKDTWHTNGSLHGPTCCQAEDLRNEQSTLSDRIDFIFTRGSVWVGSPFLVGNDLARRRAHGIWPSDHAGLVATVEALG